MKRNKFDDKDVVILTNLYNAQQGKDITNLAKSFAMVANIEYSENLRKSISALLIRKGIHVTKPIVTSEQTPIETIFEKTDNRKLKNKKYYLFTSAQNATKVHKELFNNILAYKKFLDAELSVILYRYKNPTSVFTDIDYEHWSPEILQFADTNRHDIHKYLTVLGDIKTQPTATSPLTGFENISGDKTAILGHPKLQLKTIPVLEGHPKKIILTTGAVTVPNYTNTKVGKRGEFYHNLGFVIVEIEDDETFYIRQVEALEDGSFTDLIYNVNNGEVTENNKAAALVWGDTHIGQTNPAILPQTIALQNKLNIATEVHHDIIDGSSVNNHITNDPVQQFFRMKEGKHEVEREFNLMIDFLKKRPTKKIIVRSNHDDRFDRWVVSQDWKKDIVNALPYLEYTASVLQGKANNGIVPYVISKHFTSSEVLCLGYDDSYILKGFELAHHGHLGTNGSRGNVEQYRKMSTKIILGHYHSPSRIDKVLTVGTSTYLREGYNKGASNWLNAHVLIHDNGTAQHIIFVNGKFTTFKI